MNASDGIPERAQEIRDRIGWGDYGNGPIDLRQEVMDLCREVAILAHQVSAIITAQDEATERSLES